jgi:hypothetical protein
VGGVTATVPDLLRRFVPTPHGHTLSNQRGTTVIESNDENFADELFGRFRRLAPESLPEAMEYVRVIVEDSLAEDGDALTRVDAGPLRTLLRGTTTMLIYDSESRELFAFIAQGVSCNEFYQRLLPAVVHQERPRGPALGRVELQTGDNGSIAR